MSTQDRLGRMLTDQFSHERHQITGHRVVPAHGTYYTDKGFHWQVLEGYWASMGLGSWEYPLVALQTEDDARAFVETMKHTVGKYLG